VRDAAHPDSEAQRDDVLAVLSELGVAEDEERAFVEVLNKIDLLDTDERSAMKATARLSQGRAALTPGDPARIAISAVTGEGVDELQDLVDAVLTADRGCFVIELPGDAGAARALLYEVGDVTAEENTDGVPRLTVRLSEKSLGQFKKAHPAAVVAAKAEDARRRA
jgi:GTP-binding protein HflX